MPCVAERPRQDVAIYTCDQCGASSFASRCVEVDAMARPDCSAQVAMPFFPSLAMERTKVKAKAKVPIPPPPPFLGHAVCVMQLHVTVARSGIRFI